MVSVQVNGHERKFEGDPSMPLMWFLRDELASLERSSAAALVFVALARSTFRARRPALARSPCPTWRASR